MWLVNGCQKPQISPSLACLVSILLHRKDGGQEQTCNQVVAVSLPAVETCVWRIVVSCLREPERVRTHILKMREDLTIESHKGAIERQIMKIEKRKDNILKMAGTAIDDDSTVIL